MQTFLALSLLFLQLQIPYIMSKSILFLLSVLISGPFLGAQSCNCIDNLNTTITKTEANYAGFPSKTSGTKQQVYRTLTAHLRTKASTANEVTTCYALLREYVQFFQDKHFTISRWKPESEWEKRPAISLEQFKSQLSSAELHPLEGIWINPDSTLKIGIQRGNDQSFQATVLESRDSKTPPGLVYYQIRQEGEKFLVESHDVQGSNKYYARQQGNLFQNWSFDLWGKVYPQSITKEELEEMKTWRKGNNGLDFYQFSPYSAYLKIPTFINNDEKIQQLVSAHDEQIRSCENLIVDLRGNGGGNTGWAALLPYVMTNTIVQGNSWLRVSPDNVKLKLEELGPMINNPVPDELKKYFTDEHMAALRKANAELPSAKDDFYPIRGLDIPLDSIAAYPKKIALLVDELCGSSTEYFMFLMRQSKKVRTYGRNTIGMMDYEGPSVSTPLPCNQFVLRIPVSRSSWTEKKPIDLSGFRPDVRLKLPDKQWVEWVQNRMERKESHKN